MAITKNMTPSLTAEILVHEFSHAFFNDLTEEVITLFAKEAVGTLVKSGLIKSEKEEEGLE